MLTLNAHYDGKTIVPDEPVSLATNQKLRITIEALEPTRTQTPAKRTFLIQPGVITHVAPDFDEYLGDDFWGFSDDKAAE